MMHELLDLLLASTLAVGVAILVVLAIRTLWLRYLGAASVLWLWLLIPAALLAVLLPAPRASAPAPNGGAGLALTLESSHAAQTAEFGAPHSTLAALTNSDVLLALWAAGAVLVALWLGLLQYRFRSRLGPLIPFADGTLRSARTDVGPILIGIVRPRIVLPIDFEERYTPLQQRLVVAHERVHLGRGDLHVNLLFCALRCMHWFNPLVHLAADRLRLDQELACDAAVLRDEASARRAYADAMLSTELAGLGPPLGCRWQSSHPLKRRIAMLKRPPQRRPVRMLSRLLAVSLAVSLGTIAWAAQPPRPPLPEPVPSVAIPAPERAATPAVPADPPRQPVPAQAPAPEANDLPAAPAADEVPAITPEPTRAPRPHPAQPPPPAPPRDQTPAKPATEAQPAPAPLSHRPATQLAFTQPTPERNTSESETSRPEASRPEASEHQETDASDTALFEPPQLVQDRDLLFPESFVRGKKPRREGEVVIRALVDKRGFVSRTSVERSEVDSVVDRAAEDSVRSWRFKPATLDGKPVAAEVLLPIRFPPTVAAIGDAGDAPPSVPSPRRWINGRR